MSKRDRERALAGQIFRDGKLVDQEVYTEILHNTKMLLNFVRARRLKLLPGDQALCNPGHGVHNDHTKKDLRNKI